jgi:hypothetical protein
MHKLLDLHDTVGSVRPRRDTQRLCSALSHINNVGGGMLAAHGKPMVQVLLLVGCWGADSGLIRGLIRDLGNRNLGLGDLGFGD